MIDLRYYKILLNAIAWGRNKRMNVKSFGSEMKGYQNPHHDHADENISALQTKLNRLDVIVHAMWELLKENDVGEEKLRAKVNEVIANGPKSRRPSYEPIIVKCPRCGKAIQESRGTPLVGRCIFCGYQVIFYPYSEDTSADTPESAAEIEQDQIDQ